MVSNQTAWEWLKSELAARLGPEEAEALFREYNAKLHRQYVDKRRADAQKELPGLVARRLVAMAEGRDAEVRRLDRMIEARQKLLEGR